MTRRVAITGCGVVSSLGDSAAALYDALVSGRSGVGPIEGFSTAELGCHRGGEIKDFKAKDYLGRRNLRALDRTGSLVTVATALALADSDWAEDDRTQHELGLVLGTMYCSVATIAAFDRRAVEAGSIYASPFDFANSVINAAAGQAAIWHGLRGMNSTIACGAASGLRAIAYAAEAIRAGRAEVVVAGGAEELCEESFLAFDRSGRLCRTGDGDRPCAVPLHAGRNGSLLGEGAAVVVLESFESAARRGAAVRAEVLGFGAAFDPSRGGDPARAQRASVLSIEAGLGMGGLDPGTIGGLSLAADGSPEDMIEARAMAAVFGGHAAELPACAVAANLGQCLGAGGGMQAVVAVESLRHGRLPGVLGLDELDPACPLDSVQAGSAELSSGALLLSAGSPDGHRCSVVLAAAGFGA